MEQKNKNHRKQCKCHNILRLFCMKLFLQLKMTLSKRYMGQVFEKIPFFHFAEVYLETVTTNISIFYVRYNPGSMDISVHCVKIIRLQEPVTMFGVVECSKIKIIIRF